MIIENPDAFKCWLTSILEPLCDADPAALAKYVYALVKKDKTVEELREGMLDQLDVFLQQETKPFVEMLFVSLETLEYLRHEPPAPAAAPAEPHSAANGSPEEPAAAAPAPDPAPSGPAAPAALAPAPAPAAPRQRVVVQRGGGERARPPHLTEQALSKMTALNELLEEPVEQPPRRRDRRSDSARERRRRSRSWERRGRAPPRRHNDMHAERRRGPGASRSPSPRRYRNRSPPQHPAHPAHAAHIERALTRSRSRSPLLAGRERRAREMERDRESRDRDRRDREPRDRERDRSRSRSCGTPTQESERALLPPRHPAHPAPHHLPPHSYKRRCRDFDEKGYCMRGDLCQWDHGADPLVLEDAALTRVLAIPAPPPVPEYNPLVPEIWGGAPPGPAPPPPPPGLPPYPPAHLLPHPPRELIPIPRVRAGGPPGPPAPRHHAPRFEHKKPFDYSRLGGGRGGAGGGNCSLEVRKVPRGMNDIAHLNRHFSKFGKIVNIQVCFEGDPEAALVTFSQHVEASVAYKSTEAVLNNRFIKLFWHNQENKQENTPPGGAPPAPAPAPPGTAPLAPAQPPPPGAHHTHHKVLINKDNMRATAQVKADAAADKLAKEALTANGQDSRKPPAAAAAAAAPAAKHKPRGAQAQQVLEMYKRAQGLLATQLQQQRTLIQKLETGSVSGASRAALLAAISSAQEGIEKLRTELLAYNKKLLPAAPAAQEESVAQRLGRLQLAQGNTKRAQTREEAQKSILDAELDLLKKQQEGADVTELTRRVEEMRARLALQHPARHPAPHPAHHPAHARRHLPARGGRVFNSAMHYTRGAAAAGAAGAGAGAAAAGAEARLVDHRPRTLLISGFESDELEPLLKHFEQFGAVVGKQVNLCVPELTLQYKLRAHAELAAHRGRHYNERTLTITWVTGNKPIAPVTPTAPAAPAAPTAPAAPAPPPVDGAATAADKMDDAECPAAPAAAPAGPAPAADADADAAAEARLLLDEEDDEDEHRSWRR